MPNHKYIGSQVFHCIDVLDDKCGVVGRLNKRIDNLIQSTGSGYILSESFDVGGNTQDVFYYPTKDNNHLGDTYNKNRFENGNFIKHIYTATTSTNISNMTLEYDIYMERSHNVTIDICEVIHGPYLNGSTENDNLPSIHTENLNLQPGNHKSSFNFPFNFQTRTTLTIRLKFQATTGNGSDQVTMACTLYGTV